MPPATTPTPSWGWTKRYSSPSPIHLPRTLFLCRSLGIEATGVAAHHGMYWFGSSIAWNIRETMATVLAFIEIYISPPDTGEYADLYQEGTQP